MDAVDLSTPLREDEGFVTHKHRVVPSVAKQVESPAAASFEKEKKDKKKSKKSKRADAEEEHTTISTSAHNDLLSLDFPASAASDQKVPIVIEPGSKKSSDEAAQLVLYSSEEFSITYNLSLTSSKVVTVQFRTTNQNSESLNVSLLLSSSHAAAAKGSATILLAANLGSHKVSCQSADINLSTPLSSNSVSMQCSIITSSDSLLEPVSTNVPATLLLSLCATFTPFALSEDEFENSLVKNSSQIGSNKVQIPSSVKSKYSFKAIAGFLRAYTVESEQSKAVSLCCKSSAGHLIYVLLKAKSESVSADVKCVSGSKGDAEALASEITRSLSLLSL